MLRRLGEALRRRRSVLAWVIGVPGCGLLAWAGWEVSRALGLAIAGALLIVIAEILDEPTRPAP